MNKHSKYSKLLNLTRALLLGFVLISIGFFMGKEYARQKSGTLSFGPVASSHSELVRVYYMHGNMRCKTCNLIESMTKKLVENKYAQAVKDGRVEFLPENFQKNKKLAEKFDVFASCVVVAKLVKGKVIRYDNLNEVWDLYENPPAFNKYLSNAINDCLEAEKPQGGD
jgi:uncharacterized protein YlbG (UPF0298 family)